MELGLVVPEADHLDDFTRKFLGTLPIQVTTRHQGAFADMLDREHCGSVAPELFWQIILLPKSADQQRRPKADRHQSTQARTRSAGRVHAGPDDNGGFD